VNYNCIFGTDKAEDSKRISYQKVEKRIGCKEKTLDSFQQVRI
jgi:hypothetical protein